MDFIHVASLRDELDLPVFKTGAENGRPVRELRLAEVDLDQTVELVRFDLPEDQVVPLLELGIMPGCEICPIRRSPSGDPIVMVDGTMLALRQSMASCICVKLASDRDLD